MQADTALYFIYLLGVALAIIAMRYLPIIYHSLVHLLNCFKTLQICLPAQQGQLVLY